MPRVIDNALNANISIISFAIELIWFVMNCAKLVIFTDFLLLAGKLKHYEILGEHIGLDLGIMFVSTGGTIKKFLLLINNG